MLKKIVLTQMTNGAVKTDEWTELAHIQLVHGKNAATDMHFVQNKQYSKPTDTIK